MGKKRQELKVSFYKLTLLLSCGMMVGFSNYVIALNVKIKTIPKVTSYQQTEIRGTIVSENGNKLSGVTVYNASRKVTQRTDYTGGFVMTGDIGDIVEIKSVGFQSQQIVIESTKELSIVLKVEESALEEVVVTAIGIKQQKKKVGYATQEVKTEVLQHSKTMNIGNALTGQVAGLIVNNPTGIFQAPSFSLRGRKPLIVLDGIPIETDFFDIPSQNIENINVLKGTAASTLYGSRGRDGAILITTRNAKVDNLELNVGTTNMMSAGFTVFPKSQKEFGSGSNGKYEFWDGADGGISDGDMTWGPKLNTGIKVAQWNSPIRDKQTGEVIPWWGDVSGTIYNNKSRYERVPIDWVSHDNLRDFLQTGLVNENYVSLSYKTDKFNIFSSGKYAFQKGQVPNTKLNTGGLNINSSYRFNDKIQFDLNLSYNKVKSPNYPRYGYGPKNHMYTILLWMGNDVNGRELDQNRYINGQEGYRQANYNYAWYNNPYFAAYELNQVFDQDVLHGQSLLKWDVTSDFRLQGRVAARQKSVFEDMQSPKSYMNYGDSRSGDYKMWSNKQLNFDADILATYNKTLNDNFGLTLNAGASTFQRTINKINQSTDGLVVPFIYSLNNTQGPVKAENYNEQEVIRSVYASLNLDILKSTYLNFSGRNDWGSTLPAKNASYFYPSISLSSILSDYFKMPRGVDYFKVYSSWATVSKGLDAYSVSAVYNKDFTYGSIPSVSYPDKLINTNIFPEKAVTYEVGTAFGFMKNRLSVDLTYYNTIDQLTIIDLGVSQASGFNSRKVNGPQFRTQGFEVMISSEIFRRKSFSWNTAVNWSRSVKKLEKVYGDLKTLGDLRIGDRADSFYDYTWQKSPDGKVILNGNTGMPIRDAYKTNLGYFNPDWQFGFLNVFKVNDFTINIDIDGSIGGIMRSQTIEKMWWGGKHPSSTLYRQQEYDAGKNVYFPDGVKQTGGELVRDVNGAIVLDSRTFEAYTDAVNWQAWAQNYPYRARITEGESKLFANVFDRSFVKLRRLAVGYDLNKVIKSKQMKSLDASVFGYNLFMLKKVPYVDPDFGIGNDDNLQDPSARYIGVALNFKF